MSSKLDHDPRVTVWTKAFQILTAIVRGSKPETLQMNLDCMSKCYEITKAKSIYIY